MTKEEAVATLRGYNEWRRYDGPVGEGPTQPKPLAIGEAIDTVCDALERQENLPSDLDEAARKYEFSCYKRACFHPEHKWPSTTKDAFIAGAEWQKEQFEKNRLANCDKLTKEEYDLETDFATEIIEKEHRQPTFTDAINYGMRVMREQLMKEAVEGVVIDSGFDDGIAFVTMNIPDRRYDRGDKVKLIVVKED